MTVVKHHLFPAKIFFDESEKRDAVICFKDVVFAGESPLRSTRPIFAPRKMQGADIKMKFSGKQRGKF